MCSEAKYSQRFRYKWKKKLHNTIHNTTLKMHEDEEKTKYSWKVFKILVFDYKYSTIVKKYSNTLFEYMKIGPQIQYSNIYNYTDLVFEYILEY
jgi:hypothetical protein